MADQDGSLATLYEFVQQLARFSETIPALLAQGDLDEIRRSLAASRRLHSLFQVAKDNARRTLEAQPNHPLVQQMNQLLPRIQAGDQATLAWLERPLPDAVELLRSPEGIALLADVTLPLAWDPAVDIVILVGSGTGPLVRELLGRGQARIVVYGPDEGLPESVVSAHSLLDLRHALLTFPGRTPQITIRRLPGVSDPLLQEVAEQARESFGNLVAARNTIDEFGETWILQGLANLPHVARWPSVSSLYEHFPGCPFVLIAPGPSLAKNVHRLRELKGRAILCALGHALGTLERAGVVPDLILSLDSQDLRYHFEGFPIGQVEAVLLGVTVHPELYKLGAKRFFTVAGNSILDDWVYQCLEERPALRSGGSVACSAFSLAVAWQCDPILCVGLDLSFPGGRFYAEHSCDGDLTFKASPDGSFTTEGGSTKYQELDQIQADEGHRPTQWMEVPGYHGGSVATSVIFQMFLRWFQNAALSEQGNRQLWNCTEGGAFIPGMEHLPLAQALARLPERLPIDFAAELDRALSGVHRTGRIEKMHRRTEEMLSGMALCVKNARRCREIAERPHPDLAKLQRAEQALVQSLQPVLFISLLAQKAIREATEHVGVLNVAENLKKTIQLFRVIEKAGELLQPHLERTAAELVSTSNSQNSPSDRG